MASLVQSIFLSIHNISFFVIFASRCILSRLRTNDLIGCRLNQLVWRKYEFGKVLELVDNWRPHGESNPGYRRERASMPPQQYWFSLLFPFMRVIRNINRHHVLCPLLCPYWNMVYPSRRVRWFIKASNEASLASLSLIFPRFSGHTEELVL